MTIAVEPAHEQVPGVLLVDPVVGDGLAAAAALRHAGLAPVVVTSLEAAVAHARALAPAAVIARLGDTLVVDARAAAALRALAERCAAVIAVAPGLPASERLRAYDMGCTEVLTHAPPAAELAAHVRALGRLAGASSPAPAPLRVGRLELDTERRTAYRDGAPVHLRPKEYDLLARLVARRGAVVTRAELLAEVWGYQPDLATRTLDHHVFRLRRHVEDDPRHPVLLVTVARVGYRLLHEPLATSFGMR